MNLPPLPDLPDCTLGIVRRIKQSYSETMAESIFSIAMEEYARQAVREAVAAAVPKRSTGWAAPRDRYAVPVLFSPYTGEPRDVRDVQSDPQGILIQPPGNVNMIAAAPEVKP